MSGSVATETPAAIPAPHEISDLDELAEMLDEATDEQRLQWMYGVSGRRMSDLFERCEGRAVHVDDLVAPDGDPTPCRGKNGLLLFNRFAKVFARVDDQVVGYNRTGALQTWFAGPGHYTAFDGTEHVDGQPGEVVVDYRVLPERTHPDFPPLRSNKRGGSIIVYAWMYDIIRRVSRDVFIGDSFRKLPGGAPFMLVRPPR